MGTNQMHPMMRSFSERGDRQGYSSPTMFPAEIHVSQYLYPETPKARAAVNAENPVRKRGIEAIKTVLPTSSEKYFMPPICHLSLPQRVCLLINLPKTRTH